MPFQPQNLRHYLYLSYKVLFLNFVPNLWILSSSIKVTNIVSGNSIEVSLKNLKLKRNERGRQASSFIWDAINLMKYYGVIVKQGINAIPGQIWRLGFDSAIVNWTGLLLTANSKTEKHSKMVSFEKLYNCMPN